MNTRKNPLELRLDTVVTAMADTTFPSTKSDSLNFANEITNRFFLSSNYNFNLYARQTATLSLSIANKKDNTFYMRDQNNVSLSAALTTFYKIPLQTTIAFILSHNETSAALFDTVANRYLTTTQSQAFNYQTLSLSGRYRMLDERLILTATLAPSFGDFKRLLVQAGVDYQLMNNQYLVGQFDFIQNPGIGNDVIASILYRITF
jgi:hypothetical protein